MENTEQLPIFLSIMVSFNLLAGGYDLFIALYSFDTTDSSLTLVDKFPTGQNPSWIAFNGDRSVLYATNEFTQGAVQSFEVSPDGALSAAVQTISSGGDSPAHVTQLSNGQVAVMNYNSGDGRVLSTVDGSPAEFVDTAPLITFPKGPTNISHPHQTVEHKGELFVPDLGADQIWRLASDNATGEWNIVGNIPQDLGTGPRHIAFKDDYLYTLHELSSTLTLNKLAPAANVTTIEYLANVTTLPEHQPLYARYQAAEILIPPTSKEFPTPYIYVSNRNTNSTEAIGDSIAIFEHVNKGKNNEALKLINQFFTGLSQVRGMNFDESTKYLAAAGVNALGGFRVFERVDGGKNFTLIAENEEVETRTSVIWL